MDGSSVLAPRTDALAARRAREIRAERQHVARRAVAYVLTTLLAVAFAVPFLWMVSSSLKTLSDMAQFPPSWIPHPFAWSNYPDAMAVVPFGQFFENSAIITFTAMVGQLLSCSLVAYGFARLRFKGSNFWFVVLLSTMMLPSQVTLIPQYILFRRLGWVDTYLPLIVPAYFASAFYVFLLRQFFLTIPRELDEAAIVDGAGRFAIYRRLILPLSKPILVAIVAFSFIGHWNDFFGPLIYLTSADKMTVAVGLLAFQGQNQNLMMAASVVALLPVIVVFFLGQRYFIEGITLTGMKEG
jgi:multiple sugar transport system permease protein